MARALIVLTLLLLPVPTFAQTNTEPDDGNTLLRRCSTMEREYGDLSGAERFDRTICTAYLRGIRDAESMHAFAHSASFCVPQQVTNGQLALVVLKGLKEHPETLHLDDTKLIYGILQRVYPCNRAMR